MQVTRAFFDPGVSLVATLGLMAVVLMIWTVPRAYKLRDVGIPAPALIGLSALAAGLVGYATTHQLAGAVLATALSVLVLSAVRLALPRLSAAGVIEMALGPLSLILLTPWSWLLLQEQGFPLWSRLGALAGAGVGAVVLGFGFATKLVDEAVHTHARWRRPTQALAPRRGLSAPKVSIHVPCYAEPPEVVIATLERLARLNYANFEVLVCDNNTADEALWRPLQRWCREQTQRRPQVPFRFFHVAPLAGAKAGALNFLLQHTAQDAQIVSVIDADYLAEPDFLARLTGFFADERIGFVQTPHDYRPDGSAYQAMCYWEYMPSNKLGLASVNEYDCAYTIGTMCLFRKDAIEAAGGWAEWCLTEDSEISVRIRALGYQGMYVNETFGRGLIPETYDDYKKQRFRWTAGPVQQLLVHWRLFLPTAFGGSPNMHGWVKLMEIHRSIAPLAGVAGAAMGAATAAAALWLTATDRLPTLTLPHVFWVALGLGAVSSLAKLWQRYRLTGCPSPSGVLGAEVARISLDYVKMVAAIAPLSGRPIKWRRTPKFAASGSALQALLATRTELLCASVLGLLAFVPHYYRGDLGGHLAPMATAACGLGCLAFLCAPVMAVFSEVRLHTLAKAAPVETPAPAEEQPLSQVA
jgi:hypothetical protein